MIEYVPGYDCFKYLEVFEITQWKDGAIYRTKKTGKFIKSEDAGKLDKVKYTTTSISTKLSALPEMELEMFEF